MAAPWAVSLERGIERMETWYGPADATVSLGNGRLSVALNGFGRITAAQWPRPGWRDHIDYFTVASDAGPRSLSPDMGAMWAMRPGIKSAWLTGAPWRLRNQAYIYPTDAIVETRCALRHGTESLQTAFVHHSMDLLVLQVALEKMAARPRLFWFQNFAPCSRTLPELPIAGWALDGANDFAVFWDGPRRRLLHFRPTRPSLAMCARAKGLAEKNAPADAWAALANESRTGDGSVWIGTASPNEVLAWQCGQSGNESSPYAQVSRGALAGDAAAAGQVEAALELRAEEVADRYVATIFVAFGAAPHAVHAILDEALGAGVGAMRAGTIRHWESWYKDRPGTPWVAQEGGLQRQALLSIKRSTDRESGAIVRAPVVQPPLGLAWPRAGAWLSLALDMAGFREMAEKNSLFYARHYRREDEPRTPAGSFPVALNANGDEAAPRFLLDSGATAWALSMFWRHAAFVEAGAARRAYLEAVWPAVRAGGAFLATWRYAPTGEPFPAYDASALRDLQNLTQLVETHMGLAAALRIARALAREQPAAWTQAYEAMEAHIRFRFVNNPDAGLVLDPLLSYWLRGVTADSPIWEASSGSGGEAVALQASPFPAILEGKAGQLPFPDSLEAALTYIAATLKVYSPEVGGAVRSGGLD